MTLGDNKRIALSLVEEYSPDNPLLTDDEDISIRINLLYAPSYQELSEKKKIIKTKVLKDITGATSEGYTEYGLPANMYQRKRIEAFDKDNKTVQADYKIIGKKVLISNKSDAKYILEYYQYPTVITKDTNDDFMLEIDQDAQMVLPYLVANDILKADQSADYSAFLNEYQRKMSDFDPRREIPSMVVEEGVI